MQPQSTNSSIGASPIADPLAAWSQCATIAADAATATMSFWGGLLTPADSKSQPAPEPARPTTAAAFPSFFPFPTLPEPARAVERPRAVKSWYRPPHRSPMDPLFWFEPDTSHTLLPPMPFPRPSVSPSMFAAAFFPFAQPAAANPLVAFGGAMQPTQMMGQWLGGQMPPSFLPQPMPAVDPAAFWQPLMAPWLALMTPPAPAQSKQADFDPNSIANYRSAGGFATAQVIVDRSHSKSRTPGQSPEANPNLWIEIAFPWLRH